MAVALAGCAESGREGTGSATPVDGIVAVSAFEWGYEPETITVARGQAVRISLSNDGTLVHNLKIDDLETEDLGSEDDGLFVEAEEGESSGLSFVPIEAGAFDFYCTISGHRRHGMEGTLVVR